MTVRRSSLTASRSSFFPDRGSKEHFAILLFAIRLAIAKARDENSGLVQTMLFTLLDHPDQKLTLTETSSKTISDIRENLVSPRTRSAARALLHAGNNGEKNKTRPELGFGCDKVKNPFVSDVEMGSVLGSMRSEAGQIFAAGFLNRILTSDCRRRRHRQSPSAIGLGFGGNRALSAGIAISVL